MEDDLFGDLLGTARPKPSSSSSAGGAKDAPLASLPSGGAPGKQAHLVKPGPPPSKALAPDVFDGGSNGASSAPAAHDDAKPEAVLPAVPGVTKEELHAVVSGAVQAALDATFGKFVKSLRTVLEDLGKRVDAQGQSVTELQGALDGITQQLESQALNFHSRFTALDVSIKEIDRGVQALRDKQELHEAQALLAKLATDTTPAPASAPAAAAAAPAPAAAAPAPAPAPAPAAPAPAAPAPVAAPAPAPVAAPAPAPVAAPAPQLQPVYAPPAPQQQLQAPQPTVAPLAPQQHAMPPTPTAPQPGPPGAPPPPHQQQQQAPPTYYAPLPQGPPGPAPGDPYGTAPPSAAAPNAYGAPPPGPHQPQPHPGAGVPPGAPPLQPNLGYAVPAPLPQQPHLPPPHMHSGGSWMGGPPGAAPHAHPQPQPQPSGPAYPAPALSYPAPPQAQGYPAPPQGYRSSGLPPPQLQSMSSGGGGGGGGGGRGGEPPQSRPTTRSVRLEDIISDITAMGFERHQVMAVINAMQKQGQAVDLNVVIDRLTNGRY